MTDTKTQFWQAADYAGVAKYSGADKLADSAVAPLVAQARGYKTVDDPAGVKEVVAMAYTADTSRVSRRLRTMSSNGNEFLVIPWHSLEGAFQGRRVISSVQVRPSTPLPPKPGQKSRKYETLEGAASVIDLHPAATAKWFDGARTVLITEGVIKGDSALTAQLIAYGVSVDELGVHRTPDGTPADTDTATEVLRGLLERIPSDDRVAILSLIGVANWHQNPEWNAVNLKDRRVLFAFDGDLRKNRNVWREADRGFDFIETRKKGEPGLLDLGGPDAQAIMMRRGVDLSMKVGLDDFLSKIGDWDELMVLRTSALPSAPADSGDEDTAPGAVKVIDDEDGPRVVAYVKKDDGFSYGWQTVSELAGRIKSIKSLRMPTDLQVAIGEANESTTVPSGDGEVTIEVRWKDPNEVLFVREIRGPLSILDATPADWGRRGAIIHPDIRRHPEWPPRNKTADQWVQAIKAHRYEDQTVTEGWDSMGWVPSENFSEDGTPAHPVFIVGESTLGVTPLYEGMNRPGVTEEILPRATSFGVNDTYRDFERRGDLDGYKRQVRDDIAEIVDAFIINTPWEKDNGPAIGAILLASALRPTCPTKPPVTVFLVGEPGSGKSWAASFMMGFWQPRGGVWSATNLPGSAEDTMAAREHSIARTPVWVVDDLAPNTSRVEMERQEAGIDAAVRASFNGAGKRRGNADGTQRAVNPPRALTIFTAENNRETLSIRQRIVSVRFQKGSTDNNGGKRIEQLTKDRENRLARLTAAMIRFWLNIDDLAETELPYLYDSAPDEASFKTWEQKHRLVQTTVAAIRQEIQLELYERHALRESDTARRASMFAELMFTLDVLRSLALWAGMDPNHPAVKVLSGTFADEGSTQGAMIAYAAADLQEFRQSTNAANLLNAIRAVMAGGEAHLENPTTPGEPPFPESMSNSAPLNRALGWTKDSRGVWTPQGKPIGYAGVPQAATNPNMWIAMLNPVNAFKIAKRNHPELIPHGQGANATWSQVWSETDRYGEPLTGVYKKPARGLQTRARFVGSSGRHDGVPVRLWNIVEGARELLGYVPDGQDGETTTDTAD